MTFAAELTQTAITEPLIADALRLLHEPGSVFEVRALGVPDRTAKGHAESLFARYDDIDDVARKVARMDAVQKPRGIYTTLADINPQLYARSPGEFSVTSAASDADVLRRRWILIDCDPCRPADTSASDDQLSAAAQRAEDVHEYLRSKCWGEAVVCLSGNGRHLLYRCDLPNDEAATLMVKSTLKALAHQFDDEAVKIDTSVFNASRIVRLYGTTARKGHDIPGFPHRRAEVIYAP